MPKAQVLVTVTAEAFVNVPDGIEDVDRYVRDNVSLAWGGADASPVQAPAISVEYFLLPEPQSEPVVEVASFESAAIVEEEPEIEYADTLPLAAGTFVASPQAEPETVSAADLSALLDDPAYRSILRTAIRKRASELIESVVDQVIAELEPLLRRQFNKNATGAQ